MYYEWALVLTFDVDGLAAQTRARLDFGRKALHGVHTHSGWDPQQLARVQHNIFAQIAKQVKPGSLWCCLCGQLGSGRRARKHVFTHDSADLCVCV